MWTLARKLSGRLQQVVEPSGLSARRENQSTDVLVDANAAGVRHRREWLVERVQVDVYLGFLTRFSWCVAAPGLRH
jgi:hypothetical protein